MSLRIPGWVPPTLGLASRLAPALTGRFVAQVVLRPRQNPPQPWETAPLAEQEVAPRSVTLANGQAGLIWEPAIASAAPWVFAQHGWEGRPTQFRPLGARLAARGFRVLAVEGPGHGRSPGPHASPWLFARGLLAAQAELGAPVAVIGHSMGGSAVPIAVAEGLRTARVVTLGSPAAVSEITDRFVRAAGLGGGAQRELRRLLDAHAGRPIRELDPEVLARQPAVAALPALVVHCVDDPIVAHAQAIRLRAAWAGSRALDTRGLGHRDLLRDPETVAAVADFIAAG